MKIGGAEVQNYEPLKKHIINRSRLLLGSLFGMIILLSILQIGVSNYFATDGIKLENIQTQLQDYKKQNLVLQEDIDANASLTAISAKAVPLGFIPEKDRILIPVAQPLAIRQ